MRPFALAAAVGLVLWLAAALLLRPGWAELLLLLGPTVVVPLGLGCVAPRAPRRLPGRWRLAAWSVEPCALALCAAFALPAGGIAALLALPWLLSTTLVALLGILHWVEHGGRLAPERAADAGLIFLAVGGAWTLASRWGMEPFGFREPIVLLTGAHFHFAGFALPLLCGLAAGVQPGRLAGAAALGVVTGVPLVAIGITVGASGWLGLELAAAAWLGGATALVALLQVRAAQRRRGSAPAALLVLSGVSLAAAMGLAVAYALGRWLGTPWLDIETMVRFHATANVFGFSLAGLLAWTLEPAPPVVTGWHAALPWLGDREDRGALDQAVLAPGIELGPRASDTRDQHTLVIGRESPGPPQPGGPFERVAAAIARFDVLPARLGSPLVARGPVETGDVLGISYRLLPGLRLVFAARVTARFEGRAEGVSRQGFTYATLAGHPFVGVETFQVEKDERDGTVCAVLGSWSRPQLPIVRALYPLVRRLQLRAARSILGHLAQRGVRGG